MRHTTHQTSRALTTLLTDFFVGLFLLVSVFYVLETVRIGFVSRFFSLTTLIYCTAVVGCAVFLFHVDSEEKNPRTHQWLLLVGFAAILFFTSPLSLWGRLLLIVIFFAIAAVLFFGTQQTSRQRGHTNE